MDVADLFEVSSSDSNWSYHLDYESDSSQKKTYYIGKNKYEERNLEKIIHSNIPENKEILESIIVESIHSNSIEALEFFINKSCNVEDICIKEKGQTLMHIAYYNNAHFTLKKLTEILPDNKITYSDCYGLSHLHIACWINDEKFVKRCIDNNVEINAAVRVDPEGYRSGYTALHFACTESLAIVELLLKNGADINAKDFLGRKPVHLVCSFFDLCDLDYMTIDDHDHLKVLKLLLDSGCDINSKDHHGNTPILSIFPEKYSALQKLSPLFPLEETVLKLEFLIERGADIKLLSNDHDSILHRAVRISLFIECPTNKLYNLYINEIRHAEMIERIINANKSIDVNAKNAQGETPLQLAIHLASYHIVKVLLNHNARLCSLNFNTNYEYSFFNRTNLPTLKVVYNILDIMHILSDKGIELSLENTLLVMKFLVHEHDTCECAIMDFSENNYSNWEKIISFASPTHLKNILYKVINAETRNKIKKANLRALKSLYHAKKIVAGFFIEQMIVDFIESLKIKFTMDEEELEDIQTEITRIKSTTLLNNITLYDLLLKNPNEIYQHVNKVNFFELKLEEKFPFFNNIIKGHVTKCLIRHFIEISAHIYFEKLISLSFPIICSKIILNFLSNRDILHLCLAAINFKKSNNKQ